MAERLGDEIEADHVVPRPNQPHRHRPGQGLADAHRVEAGNGHDRAAGAGQERFLGVVDVVGREIALDRLDAERLGKLQDDQPGDAAEATLSSSEATDSDAFSAVAVWQASRKTSGMR